MSAWNTPPDPKLVPHRTTLHEMAATSQTIRTLIVDLDVRAADLPPNRATINRRIDDLRSALINLQDEIARLERRHRMAAT